MIIFTIVKKVLYQQAVQLYYEGPVQFAQLK